MNLGKRLPIERLKYRRQRLTTDLVLSQKLNAFLLCYVYVFFWSVLALLREHVHNNVALIGWI